MDVCSTLHYVFRRTTFDQQLHHANKYHVFTRYPLILFLFFYLPSSYPISATRLCPHGDSWNSRCSPRPRLDSWKSRCIDPFPDDNRSSNPCTRTGTSIRAPNDRQDTTTRCTWDWCKLLFTYVCVSREGNACRRLRARLLDGFRSTGWIVCLCNFKNKCDAWKSMQLVELSGFLFFSTRSIHAWIFIRLYLYMVHYFWNYIKYFPLELNSKFFPFQCIKVYRWNDHFLVNLFEK